MKNQYYQPHIKNKSDNKINDDYRNNILTKHYLMMKYANI